MANNLAKLNFTAIDEDIDDEKSGRETGVPNVPNAGGVTEEGNATSSRSRSGTLGLPPKPTAPPYQWRPFTATSRVPPPLLPPAPLLHRSYTAPTSLTDHACLPLSLPRPINTANLDTTPTGVLVSTTAQSRPPSPHHPPSPSDHSPPRCDLRRAAILRSLQQRVDDMSSDNSNSGSDVEPMISEESISPSYWPD